MNDFAVEELGAKGLAWAKVNENNELEGGISKFLNDDMKIEMGAKPEDSIFFIADEFLKALLSKQEPQVMIVVHSIREEQCDEFVKIAKANAPEATVLKCRMGQSNGVNVGPGLIALFFFSDNPVSKDCEEERKLLTSILSKK